MVRGVKRRNNITRGETVVVRRTRLMVEEEVGPILVDSETA